MWSYFFSPAIVALAVTLFARNVTTRNAEADFDTYFNNMPVFLINLPTRVDRLQNMGESLAGTAFANKVCRVTPVTVNEKTDFQHWGVNIQPEIWEMVVTYFQKMNFIIVRKIPTLIRGILMVQLACN